MPAVSAALRSTSLLLGGALLSGVSLAQDYTVEELSGTHYGIAMKLAVEEDVTDVLRGVIKHFLEEKKVPLQELCTTQTNIYNYADYHPLHYACLLDRDEHIRILVEAGCDKDLESGTGVSPVHAAAEEGMLKSMKTLLELGANPKKRAIEQVVRNNDAPHRGFDGMTPATLAAEKGHVEVIKLMKEFGGAALEALKVRDVNGKVHELGYTPLQYAVSKGHRDLYRYMIFELDWATGGATKDEVVEAAKAQHRSEVAELASASEAEMETRREKWLMEMADKAGREL